MFKNNWYAFFSFNFFFYVSILKILAILLFHTIQITLKEGIQSLYYNRKKIKTLLKTCSRNARFIAFVGYNKNLKQNI